MLTLRKLLLNGAQELGIALTDEQINSIFIHLTELKKWNQKINLTAIKDEKDIIIKHLLDSFSFIKGFSPAPGLRLLDMGSGAGFPAIPIKIVHPELSIIMVESVKKKASFLRHIIRTLKLTECEVLDSRTEEISGPLLSACDIVTARAFSKIKAAITAGVPFLRPGGLLVLSRGPEETINEKDFAGAEVSMEKKIDFTLPHSEYRRAIWVFRKAG